MQSLEIEVLSREQQVIVTGVGNGYESFIGRVTMFVKCLPISDGEELVVLLSDTGAEKIIKSRKPAAEKQTKP